MKILTMNNGYISGISGGDSHILEVSKALSKKHNLKIMIPSIAEKYAKNLKKISYIAREPKTLFSIIYEYLKRTIIASKIAKKNNADLIVCCSPFIIDIIPALIHKRKFNSKVAVYQHHVIGKRKSHSILQEIQFKISLLSQKIGMIFVKHTADIIFTDNEIEKKKIAQFGVNKNKIKIQYPVINKEIIFKVKPKNKYNILFVGRLVKQKGVFDLLEAGKNLNLRIALIGDGEEKEELKNKIKEEKIKNISVLGFIPEKEKLALLKGARALVLPSYEEGYGIVIAEAILAKKPVIAYELPHYKKCFADSLITVPLGNWKELRKKIKLIESGELNTKEILRKYKQVKIFDRYDAAENLLKSI